MPLESVVLNPIGFVRTNAVGKDVRDRGRISEIVLQKKLVRALKGVEEFSHVFVIFWLHEIPIKERRIMMTHPRGREDMPLLGVFATRTPQRPNPIGFTLVELLKVEDNILTVRGLDAYDGTPILDLKPFDHWDMVKDARVPEWRMKLEKTRSRRKST